jgi:hypothetical protein
MHLMKDWHGTSLAFCGSMPESDGRMAVRAPAAAVLQEPKARLEPRLGRPRSFAFLTGFRRVANSALIP